MSTFFGTMSRKCLCLSSYFLPASLISGQAFFISISRSCSGMNNKLFWEPGRGCVGCLDGTLSPGQPVIKQLSNLSPGSFRQVVPETHVLRTLDHILYDPFPVIVGHCHPINLPLSVPHPERIRHWFPDKDEIALLRCQHHLIPINHKDAARGVAE